jgi:uncharacterized protein YjbI with pentapeptide repeats
MDISEADERWKKVRRIWADKENIWLYTIVGFVAGILVAPFFATSEDILGSLFPEIAGIVFTILVINHFNELRATRLEKEALILQMGSPDNAHAVEAVRILRIREWGWHDDTSLEGKLFPFANLEGAYLGWCNLQKTRFEGANLAKTTFYHANLKDANFKKANMTSAFLIGANLENAQLAETNLKNASFGSSVPNEVRFSLLQHLDSVGRKGMKGARNDSTANLCNASLYKADLTEAYLGNAILDNVDLSYANLLNAWGSFLIPLKYKELQNTSKLLGATMPNGQRYDGRLNLKGDLEFAKIVMKVDVNDPIDMAKFYGVSLEIYQEGQLWAKESLSEVK